MLIQIGVPILRWIFYQVTSRMNMVKINSIELEFLYLGITNHGTFNETDIANSNLKNLKVGKILDNIGELKEKKFLKLNTDGSFGILNSARQILWNKEIPLWVRILRLLEIKSFKEEEISKYLLEDKIEIIAQIEILRKKEMVLMSTFRNEKGIQKVFEILPAGLEDLEKINSQGYQNSDLKIQPSSPKIEIIQLLNEIQNQFTDEDVLSKQQRQDIIKKIEQIKEKLKI